MSSQYWKQSVWATEGYFSTGNVENVRNGHADIKFRFSSSAYQTEPA